jgi:hypothetical protein
MPYLQGRDPKVATEAAFLLVDSSTLSSVGQS